MMVSLIGCAAMTKEMVNNQGQKMYCRSAGVGWLGAPVAIIAQYSCIGRLERQGYKEVDN